MKRRLFFLLEKLSITPEERKTMVTLLLILTLVGGLRLGLAEQSTYDSEHYNAAINEFEYYSDAFYKEQQKVLARYEGTAGNKESEATLADVQVDVAHSHAYSASDTLSIKVSINRSGVQELQQLPGIGPSIANNIVRYRNENGSFKTIEDLLKVRGIGASRLESIRPYITL